MEEIMEEVLKLILSQYKGSKNELIPILQNVQEEFGYIPEEAMTEVAKFLGIPVSRIYSVVTFYAQFRLTPIGRNHIMVCRGTACHVRGASRILEELEKLLKIKEGETTPDMQFSLETVACIGACGVGPNVVINKNTYGRLSTRILSEVLEDACSIEKEKPDAG
jgi:NADH-quinone oxidoreductase subunit E